MSPISWLMLAVASIPVGRAVQKGCCRICVIAPRPEVRKQCRKRLQSRPRHSPKYTGTSLSTVILSVMHVRVVPSLWQAAGVSHVSAFVSLQAGYDGAEGVDLLSSDNESSDGSDGNSSAPDETPVDPVAEAEAIAAAQADTKPLPPADPPV